ncbi:MAG TPA: class I SAM-dependent methyltransferase [bacterium]|nr:class I SAM-dependent methyltransferase [bacterium]HPN46029.1 class I SAM-dependent methyltransferase [bacterium]
MNYFTANRNNWNDRVGPHLDDQGEFYNVPAFLAGRSSLKNVELQALGDVASKSMLHLMCHIGLDSLSWARMGAKVTGIDFSDRSIQAARNLAAKTGIHAEFILANVYDLPENLNATFDIVIATYGILCWLPDMPAFMAVVSRFLNPGGAFLLVDGHPILNMLEYNEITRYITCNDAYFHNDQPEHCVVSSSYTNSTKILNNSATYQWNHDLGYIVNSLLQNNMRLVSLLEFPFCYYRRYKDMWQDENGYWIFPPPLANPPMLFSVQATK